MNKSIVHIHTDKKFISDSTTFFMGSFRNIIIVIGETSTVEKEGFEYKYFNAFNSNSISLIVKYCSSAGLVILYGLNELKAIIVSKLDPDIIIAWRFFGYELYRKLPEYCYSEKTNKLMKRSLYAHSMSHFNKVKRLFSGIHYKSVEKLMNSVYNRVDYFLGYSPTEYKFLNKKTIILPEYIRLPYKLDCSINDKIKNFKTKRNNILVLIGNNKSPLNNHIDVIEMILSNQKSNDTKISFNLFFNYGIENNYTQKVRQLINGNENFNLIENFLTIDEFESEFEKLDALIINAYRQMGLYNIFMALQNGVKVFLNSKNVVFNWLNEEGFIISSIDELSSGDMGQKYQLSYEEKLHNFKVLEKLAANNTIANFQDKILGILQKKFVN